VRGSSDIDVMLVGLDLTLAEVLQHLESAEEALGRKVNPTCYTPQEFEQRRATPDSFVYKVLSQPTIDIFKGSE
jgi:predicted transcriptional regulator